MAASPYTGGGLATGALPAGANPYGLDPQTQAFLSALSGVAGGAGAGMAGMGAPNFMRQAYGQFNPGTPDNLLLAILQMRAQEAAALGAPYASGGMAGQSPRYSLLSG